MPNFLEVAMNLAQQQAQKKKMVADAELASIGAQYAPENFATENALRRMQTKRIPYEIAEMQAKTQAIPSQIEQQLAEAAYKRLQAKMLPWELAIKQGNLDVDRVRYSPEAIRALINYRNAATKRMPIATLSNAGKMAAEQYYIDKGLAPTGLPWKTLINQDLGEEDGLPTEGEFDDEAAKNAASLYRARNLKGSYTANLLNQKENADLIETTFGQIDPKILGQYAGMKGWVKLKNDRFQSAKGNPPPEFLQYNTMVNTTIPMLANQIRRFTKDSVLAPVYERYLKEITNHDAWYENPQTVAAQFEQLKNLFESEFQVPLSYLMDAERYQKPPQSVLRNSQKQQQRKPSKAEIEAEMKRRGLSK